jgi:transposase
LELAARYKVNPLTVANVRRRAHERGVLASLVRGEQRQRKVRWLDGEQEAQLVAVVCSTPPDGAARWSLRLIRERLVELEVVESIGLETIRTTLKKTRSSRG